MPSPILHGWNIDKKKKKARAQAFSDLLTGRIGRHMSKEINPPKEHGKRHSQR